jgi:4,5-DOPA dioxygenase extradiol
MTDVAVKSAATPRSAGAAPLPVLFIGHGSPMNALGGNAYAKHLARLGRQLPRPQAIVSISAHWVTGGTEVLDAAQPRTIHDFYGFPPELYQMTYPAPGAQALVPRITGLLERAGAKATAEWGLDHGTWTVLRHLYPAADIPVLQVSLNAALPLAGHLELGAALAPLRNEGVLILGSGNVTHNLREIDRSPNPKPMGWAVEFDQLVGRAIQDRAVSRLIDPGHFGVDAWRRAHPTLEHFVPLLYVLGAGGFASAAGGFAPGGANEPLEFPYEELQSGSLSMRSVKIG